MPITWPPRSSGTRLYSVKLGWIGLLLFNVATVAGTIALGLRCNDGNLEYREWPWSIRLIFLAALVTTAWNLTVRGRLGRVVCGAHVGRSTGIRTNTY